VFSSRLSWDLQPNPLTKLLEQKRASGAPILDLTLSNPTDAGFDYPTDEILDALADCRALCYDPSPRGLLSARQAIADLYLQGRDLQSRDSFQSRDRKGTVIHEAVTADHREALFPSRDRLQSRDREGAVMPDQILITASTSEAYSYLFKLLCDPGDEILTPRPSYPLFEFLAALESVHVRQYPLRYDGAWHIDFAALESAITDRTRAIVVVNPNNPTGSYLKPDESDRLQAICAARGIAILIDEVFFDYGFSEPPPQAPAPSALTFRMSGLSKSSGLPQLKLGWIIADGPGHESALERLELIADTYLSVATPVQLALPRLLAAGNTIREQIRERTRTNLATLRSLTAGTACQVLNVEGGWSAILQVPRTRSEESWALTLLADHNILVQPGFFFDFDSEAYLVVSLLTMPEVFRSGADLLIRA
jgi:alanine-synthesizing transaminase